MKKQRFLWSFVLVLLAFALIGCQTEDGGQTDEQPTGEAQTEATRFPECFMLEENTVLTDIYQFEGRIVSKNDAHNLVAVEKKSLLPSNEEKKTVIVYDLTTGEEIFSRSVKTPYGSVNAPANTMTVSIENYPIIRVVENKQKTNTGDDGNPIYVDNYTYTYYLVGNQAKMLVNGTQNEDFRVRLVNGVYLCTLGDDTYWIGSTGEVLHTDKTVLVDSYLGNNDAEHFFNFDAEYYGYLYTWEYTELSKTILVYNKEGKCIVQYNHDPLTVGGDVAQILQPKIFVLNDGNVFVQECLLLDDKATEYDLLYSNQKFDVVSKILDFKTGEETVLNIDYMVFDFESDYAREEDNSKFGFRLAPGYENQAFIAKLENKKVNNSLQYVVLDNAMTVKYTLPNRYLQEKATYETIIPDKDGYYAFLEHGNTYRRYRFNYEGEILYECPDAFGLLFRWNDYVVTNYGIFDTDGKCLYDFETSMFASPESVPFNFVWGDDLYLERYNYETGATETYIMQKDIMQPMLLCDGIKESYTFRWKYAIHYNSETGTYSVINENQKTLLRIQDDQIVNGLTDFITADEILYVNAHVDGTPFVYVITPKTATAVSK